MPKAVTFDDWKTIINLAGGPKAGGGGGLPADADQIVGRKSSAWPETQEYETLTACGTTERRFLAPEETGRCRMLCW